MVGLVVGTEWEDGSADSVEYLVEDGPTDSVDCLVEDDSVDSIEDSVGFTEEEMVVVVTVEVCEVVEEGVAEDEVESVEVVVVVVEEEVEASVVDVVAVVEVADVGVTVVLVVALVALVVWVVELEVSVLELEVWVVELDVSVLDVEEWVVEAELELEEGCFPTAKQLFSNAEMAAEALSLGQDCLKQDSMASLLFVQIQPKSPRLSQCCLETSATQAKRQAGGVASTTVAKVATEAMAVSFMVYLKGYRVGVDGLRGVFRMSFFFKKNGKKKRNKTKK